MEIALRLLVHVKAERITGPYPPAGYTWLLFHGQKVYFNGEPVFVRKEQ